MYYIIFILMQCMFLNAATYIFDKEINGKHTQNVWKKEIKDGIPTIEGKSINGTSYLEYSKNYFVQKMIYKNANFIQEYNLKKKKLIVKKTVGKEVVEKVFSLPYVWVQEFDFGLKYFLESKLFRYKFCTVNPKNLTLNNLVAIKQENADIKIIDKIYKTKKVKVTLQGIKKFFWSAQLWYDVNTNNLLKYVANEGPGTPTSTITLIKIDE